jgi:hypothetical protein
LRSLARYDFNFKPKTPGIKLEKAKTGERRDRVPKRETGIFARSQMHTLLDVSTVVKMTWDTAWAIDLTSFISKYTLTIYKQQRPKIHTNNSSRYASICGGPAQSTISTVLLSPTTRMAAQVFGQNQVQVHSPSYTHEAN